jgi:hypothetical protein
MGTLDGFGLNVPDFMINTTINRTYLQVKSTLTRSMRVRSWIADRQNRHSMIKVSV